MSSYVNSYWSWSDSKLTTTVHMVAGNPFDPVDCWYKHSLSHSWKIDIRYSLIRRFIRYHPKILKSLICYWYTFTIFFFFYSCCSHLEHRTSVKCFVSLQFLNLRQTVELLGRGISPSQGRYLTQTQNKHEQTSMPWVGFEPTITVF
jgi:hypothetical protein